MPTLHVLWVEGAVTLADPTGAATTGWEAVAGIGSVALGMVFLGSLTLMLASTRHRNAQRRAEIDHVPTAGRRLFDSEG
ncbi:MAG: hypothetical protein WAW88_09635 [Nocardioides sp.]